MMKLDQLLAKPTNFQNKNDLISMIVAKYSLTNNAQIKNVKTIELFQSKKLKESSIPDEIRMFTNLIELYQDLLPFSDKI